MSESHDIEQIAGAIGSVMPAMAIRDAVLIARAILPLIRAAEVRGAENMRDRATVAIRAQMKDFLSEQYAVGQPMASFSERFACDQCLLAVAALPPIKEG